MEEKSCRRVEATGNGDVGEKAQQDEHEGRHEKLAGSLDALLHATGDHADDHEHEHRMPEGRGLPIAGECLEGRGSAVRMSAGQVQGDRQIV